MLEYKIKPERVIEYNGQKICSFVRNSDSNIDWETVESFGEEWNKFSSFDGEEIEQIGNDYFDIVDFQKIDKQSVVLDVGCGTGRWSKYLSQKVKFIEAIDPSKAVFSAAKSLKGETNVRISQASVDSIPFEDNSFDFVFSLGVLHHIPNTKEAIKRCVEKVRPGGFLLLYLYYNLDNRGSIYKFIFFLSHIIRRIISKLPSGLKKTICDLMAILFYMPFVLLSKILYKIPVLRKYVALIPLSYYRDKTFNVIRNDALDRFGTPLEQRFSRKEIESMMINSGLSDIEFSNKPPYWHCIGKKI